MWKILNEIKNVDNKGNVHAPFQLFTIKINFFFTHTKLVWTILSMDFVLEIYNYYV